MFISSYEFVAHPVHGQKKSWLLRNGLEFLPNSHDMSIHCSSGREVFIPPDLVEQPLAAQSLPGVAKKMLQQLKFLARKLHRVSAARHLVAAQIHVHITKGIPVLLF